MNYAVQLDGVVHVRIDTRIMFQYAPGVVDGKNIGWRQRSKRRTEPVHQHAIVTDRDAEVPGIRDAETGTKQNTRCATEIKLDRFRHTVLPKAEQYMPIYFEGAPSLPLLAEVG